MDYEQKMKRLQEIIEILESGNAKFDEATKLFAEGAKLSKELSQIFEDNKGKISIIREELSGIIKEEDLL